MKYTVVLIMAPIFGYFVRNYLLWSIICEMYDVSTHQLGVLVMYWCHMRWLKYQQDNLGVYTW